MIKDASGSMFASLPSLLSANCVDDQTERPQIYTKDGKCYLFTISHRGTMAAGVDGPDGVYGFVGNGIRSDILPLNKGSGLVRIIRACTRATRVTRPAHRHSLSRTAEMMAARGSTMRTIPS